MPNFQSIEYCENAPFNIHTSLIYLSVFDDEKVFIAFISRFHAKRVYFFLAGSDKLVYFSWQFHRLGIVVIFHQLNGRNKN
jgi:hypothetical protein